jgi:hypothetical protein
MEVSMKALPERLTTSEAAVAAGVSIPQIHRIIDEKILPEDLYSTDQMRTFRTDACVLIAFYFETADWLTAQARLRTIRSAMTHCSSWEEWRNCTIEDRWVTVHFSDIWKGDIQLSAGGYLAGRCAGWQTEPGKPRGAAYLSVPRAVEV